MKLLALNNIKTKQCPPKLLLTTTTNTIGITVRIPKHCHSCQIWGREVQLLLLKEAKFVTMEYQM